MSRSQLATRPIRTTSLLVSPPAARPLISLIIGLLVSLIQDISDPDYRIDKGINANHALMFIATNKSTEQGAWNCYYADVKLRPGMVKDKLENGYPTLSLDMSTAHDSNFNYRDGNESLAYLFDPRLDCQGKESFSDVKGLLQIDEMDTIIIIAQPTMLSIMRMRMHLRFISIPV